MNGNEKVEFHIEVNAADSLEEEIDRMTRQLLSELRELDIESAELVKGERAPLGSKGDPITIGAIALEVLPSAIPAVVGLVQSWMNRGQGRTVKFKGRGIEFEGPPEELAKLLASMKKDKIKK